MKHKTSELEGALLDAAVERCELPPGVTSGRRPVPRPFSSDWAIAGPIIERERIAIQPDIFGNEGWHGAMPEPRPGHGVVMAQNGQTPLIAAMRAYVASKFGDEVELR